MKPEINFEDFLKVDLRVGTIVEVTDFPKARKPAYQLRIDFGELGIKKSSAQITDLYTKEDIAKQTSFCNFKFQTETNCEFHERVLGFGDLQYRRRGCLTASF